MRSAVTEREKQAWYWFMETFVDCVAGKVQGGQQSKYLVPIRDSVITVSDEAFALLLLDNYETKWHAQHEHRTQAKTMAFIKMPRMHGKYTSKTMGQASSVVGKLLAPTCIQHCAYVFKRSAQPPKDR